MKDGTQEAFVLKWREPVMCARDLDYRDYGICDLLIRNRIILIMLCDIERNTGFGKELQLTQQAS